MSRADSNSNKTSSYGDIRHEDIDEELNLMRPELQNLEMNMMVALNKWVLTDTMIGNFGIYGIKYPQLSSLNRDDLIKLGITDNQMQDEMLEEFSHLTGQDPSLRAVISSVVGDLQDQQKDTETVSMVQTLQEQIYRLNTLLAAITFQVGISSSSAPGIVVNQRFCSAQIVMDLLGQLGTHTAQMEEIIVSLSDPVKYDEIEKEFTKKKREKRRNCIAIVSTVGFFIAGLYFARRFGMRKGF
ncbi:unnamed protein product [Chironomus riparius]|uniref:SAM domain-containing protein n=1 Tax=Chironomus riparius TaxID=315576 RepID=A0A9N9WWE3_9DIPT|nr:unnamed protein product [Chironomus riparius]